MAEDSSHRGVGDRAIPRKATPALGTYPGKRVDRLPSSVLHDSLQDDGRITYGIEMKKVKSNALSREVRTHVLCCPVPAQPADRVCLPAEECEDAEDVTAGPARPKPWPRAVLAHDEVQRDEPRP